MSARSVLLAAAAACLPVHAVAGYWYEDLPYGDTTTAKNLSDDGDILFCCFSDSENPGSISYRTGVPAVFDNDPRYADFDVLRLRIDGLPDCFRNGECIAVGGGLTNARGDFVFDWHYWFSPYWSSAALWFDGHADPASVPEPSSLLLLLTAAAMTMARRAAAHGSPSAGSIPTVRLISPR